MQLRQVEAAPELLITILERVSSSSSSGSNSEKMTTKPLSAGPTGGAHEMLIAGGLCPSVITIRP